MTANQDAKLRGKRLFLRDRTYEDAVRAVANFDDPELKAVDPPIGEARGPRNYSIVTNDGIHIGIAATYNYREIDVEIGIRIWNRDYWDKGYGTEALNLLTEWAFSISSVDRAIVKVVESNMRARKCYEKCGFVEYARSPFEGYSMVWMEKVRVAR